MPVHIRHATLDDEDALGHLDRSTWSTLHSVGPRPEPLVAELDGQLVGYVRLGFATSLACNAHVRQIQGLAVAEEARRAGAGRALLRAVREEARRQGARRLTLRVLGHNAPARALYEAEGFVVEGVLPEEFLLDGEYVDDVFMGCRL